MALTPEQQFHLGRINDDRAKEDDAAIKQAKLLGKPVPEKRPPLTEHQFEFPKMVHRGWKVKKHGEKGGPQLEGAPGHFEPEESRVVHDADALAQALKEGFSHKPSGDEAKTEKPAPKK